MRHLLAALALLACLAVPASARRGEVVVTIGDMTNHRRGSYLAFNAPYTATASGFTRGAEYQDDTEVRPVHFPARSRLSWRWPNSGNAVRGYMELIFGNYDNSVPLVPVTPRRADQLTTFTTTWAVSLTGLPANFNVLREYYLTTQAGVASTKFEEVGFFYSVSDAGLSYYNSATSYGTCNDGSRNWNVRSIPGGSGDHYIMLYTGSQTLAGTTDDTAILACLVGKGLVDPTHWINGAALGVEPVRGEGSMTVADWSVTLN